MALSVLRRSRKTRRDMAWGLLFTAPWIIGFLFLIVYPTVASLYYGLTEFSIVKAPVWVGTANYVKLLTADRNFVKTMSNTLYMVVVQVPLGVVLAFATAMILNVKVRGLSLYRTIYFLPTVVPPVAATLLWLWILNPQHGVLNAILGLIGSHSPAWFGDPVWSKPAVIVMGLWGVGGSTILYLAALQGVPQEYYESATLDGANWLQRMVNITIPMVSPVTLFIAITGIINTFQIFTPAYIASSQGGGSGTSGSPQGSLLFYGLYLYANAFNYLKMGYASAMAWVLFVVILLVTLVMIRTSTYWTHYET